MLGWPYRGIDGLSLERKAAIERRYTQDVSVRGEVRGDCLGLSRYPPSPALKVRQIAEIGGSSGFREALVNVVRDRHRSPLSAVDCKCIRGPFGLIFES